MSYLTMRFFLILIFLLSSKFGKTQFSKVLAAYQDSLSEYAEQILKAPTEEKRIEANRFFLSAMRNVLKEDSAFHYDFSELPSISKLRSDDREIRILNWMLPKDNGSYRYYGFIQQYSEAKQEYNLFELNDIDSTFQDLRKFRSNEKNWPGALYYEIIEKESKLKKYYTFLGWDGNNRLTTMKVIDVLSFDLNGQPVFGEAIFQEKSSLNNRMVFEYAATNKMGLQYRKDIDRIIFDHLSPPESRLKGLYEYYGPDFSFDALEWNGSKWILVEDVDADKGIKKKAAYFRPEGKDTIKSEQFIKRNDF